MDITKLSTERIKAMAFDMLVIIEQQNNNLKILNAEIANRQKNHMNDEVTATPEIEQPGVESTEEIQTPEVAESEESITAQ